MVECPLWLILAPPLPIVHHITMQKCYDRQGINRQQVLINIECVTKTHVDESHMRPITIMARVYDGSLR
jgi:hypothetical protein